MGLSALLAFGPIKEWAGFQAWSDAQIGFFSIGLSLLGFVVGSFVERFFFQSRVNQ
jgi:hypothetical protein